MEGKMDVGIQGKVALVTGGSRGIGAAAARTLAAAGVVTVINYFQSGGQAEEVLTAITQKKGQGMTIAADVRDRGQVDRMVKTIIDRYGKIDILVNNAHINFPIKPFAELAWEEMEAKISGEMKALFNCSQAVLKEMMPRQAGKLIFVSSTLSRYPGYGFAAHAAAKAAMDGISRVMAMELGPMGITVNTIGPGLTETDATAGLPSVVKEQIAAMTPLKRVGQPEDIAGVILFLASPLADYLTGEYIPVCGGACMC
jgi:3-oxoacyl-[acyl-carrier protein] reductase